MIHITEGACSELRAHAEHCYPTEACGILLGRLDAQRLEVLEAAAAQNREAPGSAHRRYSIAPKDYRGIERSAEARSLEIVGFFHSHPDGPARPSGLDHERALPDSAYLIVSVRHGRATDLAAWTLAGDGSRLDPAPLVVSRGERAHHPEPAPTSAWLPKS